MAELVTGARRIREGWNPTPRPQMAPKSQAGALSWIKRRRREEKKAAGTYTSVIMAWDQKSGAKPKERPAKKTISPCQAKAHIAAAPAPITADIRLSLQAGSPQGMWMKSFPSKR
jgi:hypothetical protein